MPTPPMQREQAPWMGEARKVDTDLFPHRLGSTKRYLSALSPALDGAVYIKRSLERSEFPVAYPPEWYEGLRAACGIRNEAATIDFVRRNTTIPVPNVVAAFEDRGQEFIIMEKVQGAVQLFRIPPEKRAPIIAELEGFMAQLHGIKSRVFGGISGEVVVPPRMWSSRSIGMNMLEHPREAAPDSTDEYVLCHGDLNTMNILIDPDTLKIKCVLDWEYAGFYPPEFEGYWWTRDGPAVVLPGEEAMEDTAKLADFVISKATPESRERALPILAACPVEGKLGVDQETWDNWSDKMRNTEPNDRGFFLHLFGRLRADNPLQRYQPITLTLAWTYNALAALLQGTPLPPKLSERLESTVDAQLALAQAPTQLDRERDRQVLRFNALLADFRQYAVWTAVNLSRIDPPAAELLYRLVDNDRGAALPQSKVKSGTKSGKAAKSKDEKSKDKDKEEPKDASDASKLNSDEAITAPTPKTDSEPVMAAPQDKPSAPSDTTSVPSAAAVLNSHPLLDASTTTTTSSTPDLPRRSSATSPPIDPSKLNQTPAPIPIPAGAGEDRASGHGGASEPLTSPPLRSAEGGAADSAYLDAGGAPLEPSSHPTVAETGVLSPGSGSGSQTGPGPRTGQLERKEKQEGKGIIKLGSFGGEGLVAKPPPGLKVGDEEAVE